MISPADAQGELNLRLRRTPERTLQDVRELEQLLRGRGIVQAKYLELLRPGWASPDHRYVRRLASLSDAIVSAPGAGYMLENETPLETLKELAARRHAQIRAEIRELIRLRRIVAIVAGGDHNRWRQLPALAEVTRGASTGAVGRHATHALFTPEVFGADRACFGRREERKVTEVHAETIEC